jgi:hypothetical protein
VVCAARGNRPGTATVRATTREGHGTWEWEGDSVDAVQAAGDAVLVHAADHVFVLDARTGKVRAWLASDDGAIMRATVLAVGERTLIIGAERGRIVARTYELGMLPVWSLAVDGVVRAISPSQDGVLVELEDGDAFRIAALTGEAAAMPGLGLTWRASGELVTGSALGGPIPAPAKAVVVAPVVRPYNRYRPPPPKDPEAPPMSVPVQPPPSLGPSWQYTLYELAGGLRARNDYAIDYLSVRSWSRTGVACTRCWCSIRGPAIRCGRSRFRRMRPRESCSRPSLMGRRSPGRCSRNRCGSCCFDSDRGDGARPHCYTIYQWHSRFALPCGPQVAS